MDLTHDSPGAVILGGSSGSLGAARNLAKHGVRVCVLGSATSPARFSRSIDVFVKQPRELEEGDLPEYLLTMAARNGLRGWVLFPSNDEQLRVLSQHRSALAQDYVVTAPPWETVELLYDKRLTCMLAQRVGIPIPDTYVPGSADRLSSLDVDFPVVLKPAITPRFLRATNTKAYRADNRHELQDLFEKMSRIVGPSEVIVQDFISEPSKHLFSFAGYFRGGEPIAGLSVKRTRQYPKDFGRSSSFVETFEVPELRDLAARLLRAIGYTGLAEVEFMWDPKHARFELLEVNARLWGWHTLAIAAGLDLPYIAFADALGKNPPVGTVHQGLKWIRLLTDVRAVAQEVLSGGLSLRQVLASLRGPKAFAVFSPADPLPFMMEPIGLLADRMIRWSTQWRKAVRPHRFASRRGVVPQKTAREYHGPRCFPHSLLEEEQVMSYAIEHASIRCRNMEASIEYYKRMFGARVLFRRNPPGPKRITFLQIGDTLLELMDFGPAIEPVDAREHFGVHHIGIKTDDFESAYRDLKAKGADFLGEPFEPTPGIRLAFLRDPNGAVIELAMRDPEVIQEAAKQGAVNW